MINISQSKNVFAKRIFIKIVMFHDNLTLMEFSNLGFHIVFKIMYTVVRQNRQVLYVDYTRICLHKLKNKNFLKSCNFSQSISN